MTFKGWVYKHLRGKTVREISEATSIPHTAVWRAMNGRRLSQGSMKRIVEATGGEVSYEDMVRAADAEATP